MSIKLGEWEFGGPYFIKNWGPPNRPAVYVIMMKKPDAQKAPDTYYPLYLGQSVNLSEIRFYRSHHRYKCWLGEAGSGDNLHIGIHLMPDSTYEEREVLGVLLIEKLNPACNKS